MAAMRIGRKASVIWVLLGPQAVWLAGCLEVRQTIHLNADGSGRFVEVVRFDDRLIRASKSSPELAALAGFLDQKRVKERMGLFGDVTFVSHRVEDLDARGRQATTVLAFKDISKFALPAMPHRGTNWTGQKMTFRLGEPAVVHEAWRNAYYTRRPLAIAFTPKSVEPAGADKPVAPAEKEKLHALLPIVRAMLEGFRMTVRLEAFGPVEGKSRTHVIYDLQAEDLSDDDTLIKVIRWNRFPDPHLGTKGRVGPSGRAPGRDYTVGIALPYRPQAGEAPGKK